MSSNFHVSLLDDSHRPPEFSKELVRKLKEGFVDQLFHGDNDLVVDVASMSAIGPKSGGYVRDTCALGENDVTYHNNYFSQLKVIEALGSWLPLGMGAGGGDDVGSDSGSDSGGGASVESAPVTRGIPPGMWERMSEAPVAADVQQMAEPPADEPTAAMAPPPVEAVEAEPETSPAHLAAEMPDNVVVETDFVISVQLSRNAIVPTRGAVHAGADVDVACGAAARGPGRRHEERAPCRHRRRRVRAAAGWRHERADLHCPGAWPRAPAP